MPAQFTPGELLLGNTVVLASDGYLLYMLPDKQPGLPARDLRLVILRAARGTTARRTALSAPQIPMHPRQCFTALPGLCKGGGARKRGPIYTHVDEICGRDNNKELENSRPCSGIRRA